MPVRLDDDAQERLEQLALLRHMQPAALARELLMEKLEEVERSYRQKLENGALKRG
ncbi:hypothetical protein [Azotobacter chroococcum]|uniref:Ribbon-helix-helix protein, CopG family n=1 Tax=Azotobacter chroococcum TaxID=353 RepID=A0AAQ0C1D2_9GAMM|nr:hypothetical protein [Azotobacter chroococcum]QQE90251.1 hypothetical protein GKQ51_08130 [Azotobacter chroococcum]